jgi:hypothetical protein
MILLLLAAFIAICCPGLMSLGAIVMFILVGIWAIQDAVAACRKFFYGSPPVPPPPPPPPVKQPRRRKPRRKTARQLEFAFRP